MHRRQCRADLTTWCTESLYNAGQSPQAHHRLLIDHLERVSSGEIDRLMVLMPPGSAKSTYCSVLLPPWWFVRHPQSAVIAASHTLDLARRFGRRVRNTISEHATTLGYGLAPDSQAADRFATTTGGEYTALGVGGSVTGRRADLLLIDDPVASREDADSATSRDTTWDWYRNDAYTRLKPGGRVVLVMCMTGDTLVMRPDGSETPLRDIRVGDAVATYSNGSLSTSKVLNWINHGRDQVYQIKTASGIIAKANERHPFLVCTSEGLRWVRLKDLRPGQGICRVNGGSGKARHASTTGAQRRLAPEAIALPTTTKNAEPTAFGRHRTTPHLGEPSASKIATALPSKNTIDCMMRRAVSAQSAATLQARTCALTGAASFAWIIATKAAPFARFCATTATLPLDMLKRRRSPLLSQIIYDFTFDQIEEITPAGCEDVFDIEIADTENFIANGLVSHNTRWHEDDLGGRLLMDMQAGADQWTVLKLPAIAEADDAMGRDEGDALWPAWEDRTALERKRQAVGERAWWALYQQSPRPMEGALFKTAMIPVLDAAPAGGSVVRAWDLAATKQTGTRDPDWTVGVKLACVSPGRYGVLDVVRLRGGPDEVKQAIVNTAALDGKAVRISLPQDPGQAGKQQVQFLIGELSGYSVSSSPETGDKATRAMPVAAQANAGNVSVVKGSWNAAFLDELSGFPAGAKDDQVDALSRAFAAVSEPVAVPARTIRMNYMAR